MIYTTKLSHQLIHMFIDTHRFNLFKDTDCFLFFLLLSSLLFSHISKPLSNIILVTLTKLMISNTRRIV